MLGVYNYTVVMTYAGLFFSYAGMHFILRSDYRSALLCLMISGLFDMFDGTVARTKKDRTDAEKLFGIQIDSMSDVICYGVLPAMFIVKMNGFHRFSDIIGGFYVLCAVIRLCYFNVDESFQQNASSDYVRKTYEGLPVTSVAIFLPLVFALCKTFSFNLPAGGFEWRMERFGSAALALAGICFITPFKLPKPNMAGKAVLILLGLAELLFLLFFTGPKF